MPKLVWDNVGERLYETGVDRGVLYNQDQAGNYATGVVWNGLTNVTESPSGAESNPQYADNIKYINLVSAEEFAFTIEAFTYPDAFGDNDGTAAPTPGVIVGQQYRKPFGLAYRTLLGNDLKGNDFGYKLHLVYGAMAAPSEKSYATVNDSPEAATFSWECSTTPVVVGKIGSVTYRPTAHVIINSVTAPAAKLTALEDILYGTSTLTARLPLPAEVVTLISTP